MSDPGVRAVFCARGGYGSMRILDRLPWRRFQQNPKWLLGFSDVTALHLCASQLGVASLHGPNVTSLASATPFDRWLVRSSLAGRRVERRWEGLVPLRAGSARGALFGGNLTMVHSMAAARRLDPPKSALWLLEDVTERPYRIDRMLTSLRLGGVFSQASAVVFGEFSECVPGPDGVDVSQVLRRFAEEIHVPVAMGAPFGHGNRNETFVLGDSATLEADELILGACLV